MTEHTTESAEWLHVGAEVATMRSDHRSHGHAPTFAKVAKIGKRDVVLDDGQRFNVSRLDRREGGDWGWTVRLLPADAPVVTEAVERYRHQQKVSRAKAAAEDWRFGKNGVQPVDVILALAPLTGVEAEIRALFEPSALSVPPGQGSPS